MSFWLRRLVVCFGVVAAHRVFKFLEVQAGCCFCADAAHRVFELLEVQAGCLLRCCCCAW